MPATYDTLVALLVAKARRSKSKPVVGEQGLDAVLAELEDRGLVGWDKRANRYDLHPIVRGVVWSGLGDDGRRGVLNNLHAHFEAVPEIDENKVSRFEDLTPAIELYSTLIGLGRYDDAGELYYLRLDDALHFRLGISHHQIELLELLFPDGLDQLPRLRHQTYQADALIDLAYGYIGMGYPKRAISISRRGLILYSELNENTRLSSRLVIGLDALSRSLFQVGSLYESETILRNTIVTIRKLEHRYHETSNLNWLGLTLAARGINSESKVALRRALRIDVALCNLDGESFDNHFIAQAALWFSDFSAASTFASRAWELAPIVNAESHFICAARLQGEIALGLNDFATANERLHHALSRARQVSHMEDELPALIALAELRRRQYKPDEARAFLEDVWYAAERGPYPLFHADACNVLAQLERDASNTDAAIEAATQAYRLAWCDGPPFAYHWGLEAARRHLRELGAPEPELPPFDPSKYEPMPEVEIDPPDEFHAGGKRGTRPSQQRGTRGRKNKGKPSSS